MKCLEQSFVNVPSRQEKIEKYLHCSAKLMKFLLGLSSVNTRGGLWSSTIKVSESQTITEFKNEKKKPNCNWLLVREELEDHCVRSAVFHNIQLCMLFLYILLFCYRGAVYCMSVMQLQPSIRRRSSSTPSTTHWMTPSSTWTKRWCCWRWHQPIRDQAVNKDRQEICGVISKGCSCVTVIESSKGYSDPGWKPVLKFTFETQWNGA